MNKNTQIVLSKELGNLGLSEKEEEAIVVAMKTLSDGWTPHN